jgi:hypothetical protein
MTSLINKIKNYLIRPNQTHGEEMITGIKTINPSERAEFIQNSMRDGDRKRYFNTYNQQLINRISEIKSINS